MSEPIIRTLHAHLGGDQNMLHASYALESRACASGYQANLVSPLDSFHSMGKHAGVIVPETRNTVHMALDMHIDPRSSRMATGVVDALRPVRRCERPGYARVVKRRAEHGVPGAARRERRPCL